MRSISVSQPVWDAIASRGKFGETEDDVLRRVFKLPPVPGQDSNPQYVQPPRHRRSSGRRRTIATDKLSSYIDGRTLHVAFASGASRAWDLPDRSNKEALRTIRRAAASFAEEHGATIGQINAVRKALTEAGYHLTK